MFAERIDCAGCKCEIAKSDNSDVRIQMYLYGTGGECVLTSWVTLEDLKNAIKMLEEENETT